MNSKTQILWLWKILIYELWNEPLVVLVVNCSRAKSVRVKISTRRFKFAKWPAKFWKDTTVNIVCLRMLYSFSNASASPIQKFQWSLPIVDAVTEITRQTWLHSASRPCSRFHPNHPSQLLPLVSPNLWHHVSFGDLTRDALVPEHMIGTRGPRKIEPERYNEKNIEWKPEKSVKYTDPLF